MRKIPSSPAGRNIKDAQNALYLQLYHFEYNFHKENNMQHSSVCNTFWISHTLHNITNLIMNDLNRLGQKHSTKYVYISIFNWTVVALRMKQLSKMTWNELPQIFRLWNATLNIYCGANNNYDRWLLRTSRVSRWPLFYSSTEINKVQRTMLLQLSWLDTIRSAVKCSQMFVNVSC